MNNKAGRCTKLTKKSDLADASRGSLSVALAPGVVFDTPNSLALCSEALLPALQNRQAQTPSAALGIIVATPTAQLVRPTKGAPTPAARAPAIVHRSDTRAFMPGLIADSILYPPLAYSLLIVQLRALKCGNCHAKRIVASTHAPAWPLEGSRELVHAAHPIKGGIPPTKAPIQVLTTERRFRGVYTAAYNTMLSRPSDAVKGLTRVYSIATPVTPLMEPKVNACNGVMR